MVDNNTILSTLNGFQGDYKCEKCGNVQKVNIFPFIDFTKNPEYYALVKDLSIFKVKCSSCGLEKIIQFDTLILDNVHKYFIYFLTDKTLQNKFKYQVKYFVETTLNKNDEYDMNEYKSRLVLSPNDLVEKMQIFEVGLNDEAIELIKYGMFDKKFVDKNINDCLYFDGMKDADLQFVAFSSKTSTVKPQKFVVHFEFYNKVIDDINRIKDRHHNYFEVVDEDWVKSKFNLNEETTNDK